MSTKHVILGLLDVKPMSGYDLERNMKISLESLWAATYSQIYPTLHKLKAAGLIFAEDKPQKRRQRTVYSLTEAGKEELERWINAPVHYLPYRDPFRLWASYLDRIPASNAHQYITEHIAHNEARAAYLDATVDAILTGSHPLISERAKRLEPQNLRRLKATRAAVFKELAAQARFEIESARRLLEFYQALNTHDEADEMTLGKLIVSPVSSTDDA